MFIEVDTTILKHCSFYLFDDGQRQYNHFIKLGPFKLTLKKLGTVVTKTGEKMKAEKSKSWKGREDGGKIRRGTK